MRDKVTRQCLQTTIFWRRRRAKVESNWGPTAYALTQGQIGSHFFKCRVCVCIYFMLMATVSWEHHDDTITKLPSSHQVPAVIHWALSGWLVTMSFFCEKEAHISCPAQSLISHQSHHILACGQLSFRVISGWLPMSNFANLSIAVPKYAQHHLAYVGEIIHC